ncbi:MAG: GNAT family N-acetyltransferase, partial [Acidimicrobiales bacterium]
RGVARPDGTARGQDGTARDEDGGAAARVEADRRSRGGTADRLPRLDAGPYRLRGFEARDVPMVVEAGTDPVIPLVSSVAAGGGAPEAGAFVDRQRHHLRDGHAYSFVVAEADGDRGVGSIGMWLDEVDQGRATVGYWVVPSARGRGTARHALRSLSGWALRDLGIPRLQLHVEPWNVPSVRTAEGAGYRCEGLLRSWQAVGGERRDMYVYSLLAADLA